MPVQLPLSHNDLKPEEATRLVHRRPQGCAVDEHLHHHEQSIRAGGDHLLLCNLPVRALGDHVLPESKKEHVKEPQGNERGHISVGDGGFCTWLDFLPVQLS